MKKSFTKILSVLLTLISFMYIMPFNASAKEILYSGNYGTKIQWILYDNGELVISGSGSMPSNSYVSDVPWYLHHSKIKKVIIEDGITSISNHVFEGCSKVETVSLPISMSSIGVHAFRYCYALTEINIPAKVSSIGIDAFFSCDSLKKITVDSKNSRYSSDENGALFDSKTSIIKFPPLNEIDTYQIPDSVTQIGRHAFENCDNLKTVNIPTSVTGIGGGAFQDCDKLEYVDISDNVSIIFASTFTSCDSLKRITIGKNVKGIGYSYSSGDNACQSTYSTSPFSSCSSLESITVHPNNEYYSSDEYGVLFDKEKSLLIQYPIGSKHIEYTLPNTVTTIGELSFKGCSALKKLNICEGVTDIERMAFGYCENIRNISIPSSVKTIGESAFDSCCSLTYISIPEGVTKLGNFTFYDCKKLNAVTLPENLLSIGIFAFTNCDALADIYYAGTETQWQSVDYVSNSNRSLLNATIHYEHEHSYSTSVAKVPSCTESGELLYECSRGDSYSEILFKDHNYKNSVIKTPTCTEQGYTTYTCECGDSYVDDYVAELGHSHTSEITTPATHLTEGVETFTCVVCGDSYTEVVEKIAEHDYESVVTAPTCTEQGYTTYTCVCGDTYVSDYVDATGHDYKATVTRPTCTEKGYTTNVCSSCGDSYIDNYKGATGHSYDNGIVTTKPTCTKSGIKTFTCANCGDTYTEDVDALGHIPAEAIEENDVAPTCTENGSKDVVVYCSVCEEEISRETVVINATGHSYTTVVTNPTCTEQGYTTYTCSCGDSYVDDYVDATGHADSDGDGYCDMDNELLDPSVECECNCHKSGITKFFFNFILFFQRLFGSNKTCACGVAHY